MLDRIDARIRADVDGGLAGVAHDVLAARGQAPQVQAWSPQAVIELALEDVRRAKSGWTRADLVAAINAALPNYLGVHDGVDVARLLDSLADTALEYATALDAPRPGDELLPPELRLRNGRSAHEAPGVRLYATPEQVRTTLTRRMKPGLPASPSVRAASPRSRCPSSPCGGRRCGGRCRAQDLLGGDDGRLHAGNRDADVADR